MRSLIAAFVALGSACGGVGLSGECSDGELNGLETDIDCGGECGPCADGQGCAGSADCQSAVCTNQICAPPACIDGLQNGDESDIDCGGVCGATCASGAACVDAQDCASAVCVDGSCMEPTCADGAQNADESDRDCGGNCGPTCAVDQACASPADCQSGNCTPESVCGEAFRRVFITSQLTTGALGGLTGGDALCQSLADAAGLGGVYMAWLSDNLASPSTRFDPSPQPYVLVDGTVIANDFADLIDGTLLAAINLTESGDPAPATDPVCSTTTDWVHTGTSSNGQASGTSNCNNWTAVTGPGAWGRSTIASGSWTQNCSGGTTNCGELASLYCFEQ